MGDLGGLGEAGWGSVGMEVSGGGGGGGGGTQFGDDLWT